MTSSGNKFQTLEIVDFFRFQMDILNVFDELLQTGGHAEPAVFGDFAEEKIEVGLLVFLPQKIISSHHGQLVQIGQKGHIGHKSLTLRKGCKGPRIQGVKQEFGYPLDPRPLESWNP